MARLILWPGLAADERMYERLGTCGWELVTPRLLPPRSGEGWPEYARRCAAEAGVAGQDTVGGCSFGAMLAAEIARQQPVRGVVLLAGALDSGTLSWPVRGLGLLPGLVPLGWLRRLFASDLNLRLFFGAPDPEGYALMRAMLADTSDAMLRYGARLAVRRRGAPLPGAPVHALHGRDDRVMAPPPVSAVRLVDGAGHGLVFTHAEVVNDFLRDLQGRME